MIVAKGTTILVVEIYLLAADIIIIVKGSFEVAK